MSGRRITSQERNLIRSGRRYVKQSRESEFNHLGNNVESSRYVREVARLGKVGR